jgi:hypothetical protein
VQCINIYYDLYINYIQFIYIASHIYHQMLDGLSDFQKNVLYVVVLISIVVFVISAISLYYISKRKNKDNTPFPKQEQYCPDYWEDHSTMGDGSKCINTKNLGSSRNKTMDFSKSLWKGKNGLCNKAIWAKKSNLSWDGITNNKRVDCKIEGDGLVERNYNIVKNTDYAGQFDIKTVDGNLIDGKNECDSIKECNGFVYNEKTQKSHLKNISNKKAAIPTFEQHASLYVIGKGFKSYSDADNTCSSENKDNKCGVKGVDIAGDITEGFTGNSGNAPILKASKCNVKLLDDGNLVIYDTTGKPLWASNTYNKGNGPYSIKMHDNGNLVVYDNNKEQIWQSGTTDKGSGPYRVTLDETCTMGLYDSNNIKLFYANESKAEKQKAGTCSSAINYGLCENKISSSTANLIMQDDGNLVVYDKQGNYKWASGSNGKGSPPYRLMMQTDGNLVIYDKNNVATWATATNGKGGEGPFTLTVMDDKNVVMSSDSNKRIWSSRVDRVYNILDNTDYHGQFDMKNLSGSINECKNECDYTPGCNGFFYDNNGKRCYLKNIDKNTAKPRFKTSGSLHVAGTGFKSFKDIKRSYNLLQNTDYRGQGDIKDMDGTKEECMNECDVTQGCNNFFYADVAKHCWLKGLNKNNAVPNYHSGGSLYEAAGTGLISYKDGKPTWNVMTYNNTGWNDEGGGNTIYLDRHNVDCGNNPIQRFRLKRDYNPILRKNTGNYRYDYTCGVAYVNGGANVTADITENPQYKSTPSNDRGGGNNIYLDRHRVECDGGYISQFLLSHMGNPYNYQYNYRCNKTKKPMQCRDVVTKPYSNGWGNAVYLDGLDVKCNDDEVLSAFQLYRPSENTNAYWYKCCKF